MRLKNKRLSQKAREQRAFPSKRGAYAKFYRFFNVFVRARKSISVPRKRDAANTIFKISHRGVVAVPFITKRDFERYEASVAEMAGRTRAARGEMLKRIRPLRRNSDRAKLYASISIITRA